MTAPLCTYCGQTYINPCDGENPKCENKKHVDKQKAHEAQTVHTEDKPAEEATS